MFVDSQGRGTLTGTSPSAVAAEGWNAELGLCFAPGNGKTVIARRRHVGPLVVQRPFYPEGPVCHVYLLHPPGGVVAGDTLGIDLAAANGSAALVTTPAAGKFYRSAGGVARQSVALRVASGASLEWLPQETIFYQGARVRARVAIELEAGARFLGWDVVVLGRPAAGEGFSAGEVGLELRITQAAEPRYLERTLLNPEAYAAPWGLGGHSAFGTLFATPSTAAHLEAVRELIGDQPERGVTRIGDLLICRGRDMRADRLRAFFQQVWARVREDVIGHKACAPRIWAT
ncbi:urease accessory protein UreD [Methylotetracoccus oryzae]|uniref:urease accessory protein UreD n=1 Tax=Methylotetracoccus oryzae TaxID=1919059 RepID=UPI001119E675|nr:urease accessory protein UreD [Methylotetracoccus oryzae]